VEKWKSGEVEKEWQRLSRFFPHWTVSVTSAHQHISPI
jgi:hypothetical protein